jgi:hypothetical protein
MTNAVIAAVAVWSAALAQNNANQPPAGFIGNAQTTAQAESGMGQADRGRQAPIGHRQPRAKDLPPVIGENLGARSREDEAIDRKLQICRDC